MVQEERMGFEPMKAVNPTRLATERTRPLCDLSIWRRGRDSNPRRFYPSPVFKTGALPDYATSPFIGRLRFCPAEVLYDPPHHLRQLRSISTALMRQQLRRRLYSTSSGGGIRTHDLRLMKPARTATPLPHNSGPL